MTQKPFPQLTMAKMDSKKNLVFAFLIIFTSACISKEMSYVQNSTNTIAIEKQETADNLAKQRIISEDVIHFWEAYDAIQSTNDSIKQMELLKSKFISKASRGQKKMIEARRYTAEEYLQSINSYPLFWNSLRKNTNNIDAFNAELLEGVFKLQAIYPSFDPSTIYYTMGNFRSPGTGVDSLVLIGTEFALGDTNIFASELPERVQNYFKINPTDYLQFLTIHEYIHTQQNEMVHELLPLVLYEGIAEFVAVKATGQKSPWKAFTYGPQNEDFIVERLERDLFIPNSVNNWLWNSDKNEFGTSEVGYFVGFRIAKIYYEQSSNKKAAIKNLIELDYEDKESVEKLVDGTGFLSTALGELEEKFEKSKPTVISIEQFEKRHQNVSSEIKVITLHFSEAMNTKTRGFDYGPLGEDNVLRVQKVIGFSDDKKSFSFEVKLEKDKQYQSMVTGRFLSEEGYPLVPFLIDFKTK